MAVQMVAATFSREISRAPAYGFATAAAPFVRTYEEQTFPGVSFESLAPVRIVAIAAVCTICCFVRVWEDSQTHTDSISDGRSRISPGAPDSLLQ